MTLDRISAYEYAMLAEDVYKDTPGPMLAGWKRYDQRTNPEGLFVAAYTTQRRRQAVIVYRGTDQLFGKDGKQIPGIGVGAGPGGQFNDALSFYRMWRDHLARWATNGFSAAGHSLGGNLATLVAAYNGVLGVTFNAPKVGVLRQMLDGKTLSAARLVHFRGDWDPVSRLVPGGDKLGKEITLKSYGLGDLVGRGRVESMTHSMKFLREAIGVHPNGLKSPDQW